MERTQRIEEALSIVWEEAEKKITAKDALALRMLEAIKEDMVGELINDGYATVEKESVRLTRRGEERAKDIIRRQRLAERLLIDVLELGRKEMAASACEFEHILSKEVEESICTLLGHPKECPHGRPIPPGNCCAKAKEMLESIVIPLSRLSAGESGRIVYVLTHKHPQLHKLMSLGIVPGVRIAVHQTFPSVIIKVEETEIALEHEIAKEIFVKRLRGG